MFCLFLHNAGQYNNKVVSLKQKNTKLKVSIAIDDGPSEESKKYSDMAATPINRKNFIESVLDFIK
jgi:GH18 family chitinase